MVERRGITMGFCSKVLWTVALAVSAAHGPALAGADGQDKPSAHAAPANRRRTIEWLRDELAKVRQAPPDRRYTTPNWKAHDVSILVGMKRAEVRNAIGDPDVCPARDHKPCPLGEGRIVYAFYSHGRAPGNGPHLALRFDPTGVCTESEWVVPK